MDARRRSARRHAVRSTVLLPASALVSVLVPVLVSALVVGACSSGPPPTPAEYRRAVRQVCLGTRRSTTQLARPKADDAKALARYGDRSVAIQRDALRRIQELDAPSTDEPRVGEWLGLVGAALDAATASLTAQRGGDLVEAARANAEGAAAATQADAIATELGLVACVTSP